MALSRRGSNRTQSIIWPGFVDAMTGLLLVLMFVLTIFMVIQFVLRETITGQQSRLSQLSEEIAALSEALGLEQTRSTTLAGQVGTLTANLADLNSQSNEQAALILSLTAERDAQATALAEAENRITGFEAQVAGLLAQRSDLRTQVAGLEETQGRLLSEQEALNLALSQARSEIDAQTEEARLAAARREALESLISEMEAKGAADAEQLAALLAQSASASDQISNLQTRLDEAVIRISDLDADRLAEAAAAELLRQRLQNADAELTALTLALEQQRQDAENTLTLLAAARAARDDLDMRLAAAILAQQQAESNLSNALQQGSDLDARLLAALSLQENTAEELAAARAALEAAEAAKDDLTVRLAAALTAQDLAAGDLEAARTALEAALEDGANTRAEIEERLAAAVLAKQALEGELATSRTAAEATESARADLERRLAEALLAQQSLDARVQSLALTRTETEQERASLEARLAEALAAIAAAENSAAENMTEAQRQAALLATANIELSNEQALSAESQRQVELLNRQVAELRQQVGSLQSLLDIAAETDADAQVQIQNLGSQLNTAIARVAAEERRRRQLEEQERQRLEAERARLEAEAQNLERYRSEFFGRLRDVVAGQEGIRIEGDRFVFSSEVLFETGLAQLSEAGRQEIGKVAELVRQIEAGIPSGIDWVIRVDGHTDDRPLSGFGEFKNNWQLSQARALSVVLFMIEQEGIPANRLSANGFGEFQPVNTADTDEARAQNRRIELKLTER